MGANDVVHPEFEGGLEVVYDTLLQLGYPLREVHEYAEAVRRDAYDIETASSDERRTLRDMVAATAGIEIAWLMLCDGNPLIGQTLRESSIRDRTGASVVALIRDGHIVANPKSSLRFLDGDRIGIIGEPEQIESARGWLACLEEEAPRGLTPAARSHSGQPNRFCRLENLVCHRGHRERRGLLRG